MQKHIEALGKIQEALAGLEEEEAKQVVRWAAEFYGVSDQAEAKKGSRSELGRDINGDDFEDVGDFFDAAAPSTDAERALVVGYWLQNTEGQNELDAQGINNELKNLGYGIKNVTRAMADLTARKPSLARQISKGGSSKQARKKYRITQAGTRKVETMIAGDSQEEE